MGDVVGGGGDGFAPLSAQAQIAAARGLVNPIVAGQTAEINRQYNTQARNGAQAIAGYSKALAGDLSKIGQNTAGLYANAANTINAGYDSIQGTSNAASATALRDLGSKLGAIGANDPSLMKPAGLYATNAGNAGALRAVNSSNLTMQGAGAGATAAALPGIAALAGHRNLRMLGEQTNQARAQALAQLTGQIPQMTSQALSQIQSNEVNKAVANATNSYHQGLLENQQAQTPFQNAASLGSASGDKVVLKKDKNGNLVPVDTGKPKPGKGAKGAKGLSAASRLSNDRQVQNGAGALAVAMFKGNGKVDPTTAAVLRSIGLPVDDGKVPLKKAFTQIIHYFRAHGYRKALDSVLWTNAFDALGSAGYDVTLLPEYDQLVKAQNAVAANKHKGK
jgi:hypothetical protein